MVSKSAIDRGATVSGVCMASDDCGLCPLQNGCWFIEPLVVS